MATPIVACLPSNRGTATSPQLATKLKHALDTPEKQNCQHLTVLLFMCITNSSATNRAAAASLRRPSGWQVKLGDAKGPGGISAGQTEAAPLVMPLGRRSRKRNGRKWSADVTKNSNALDLQRDVFKSDSPVEIAQSLEKSAERSHRRKSTPFRSAMSMLTFYINRAGKNLSSDRAHEKLPQATISRLRVRAFSRRRVTDAKSPIQDPA